MATVACAFSLVVHADPSAKQVKAAAVGRHHLWLRVQAAPLGQPSGPRHAESHAPIRCHVHEGGISACPHGATAAPFGVHVDAK